MPGSPLHLRLLSYHFGILKLSPDCTFPTWLNDAAMFFLSKTEDECSVFCPQNHIPENISFRGGWRCFRVDGELAFDEIGVAARVSKVLADIGLSIFLVSTHDRDYVFVEEQSLAIAAEAYISANFRVSLSD
jgi:uncharacterized protein